jgi:hypothetical protein
MTIDRECRRLIEMEENECGISRFHFDNLCAVLLQFQIWDKFHVRENGRADDMHKADDCIQTALVMPKLPTLSKYCLKRFRAVVFV